MELRALTLGDWVDDPKTGERTSQYNRFQHILSLGERAEALGFDGFHIGEHHFCDYIVSNPVPLLSAIAAKTERIKLSTGVALLANRDPVLVAEDYAALDLISGGRMELCVGRGNAFLECYRQMGQDVGASQGAFEQNLDLLLRIWSGAPVTSDGGTRPPLDEAKVQPLPHKDPSRMRPAIWVGAGSGEASVRAVADRKLDLQLPGVFAAAPAFAELAKLYRELHPEGRIGFTAHVYLDDDGARAKADWAPYHIAYLNWVNGIIVGGSNGLIPERPAPTPERAYLHPEKSPALCGSPSEVADRILAWNEVLGGLDVLLLKFDGGALPDEAVERSMTLAAGPMRDALRAALTPAAAE